MPHTYVPKSTPFQHQEHWLEKTWRTPVHAVFWEQGTGKSKLIIDTAARLWLEGEIDAVLIVAPNSVHTNWIQQELPLHLRDDIMEQSRTHIYRTSKSATMWHQAEVRATIRHRGLAWMAISYNAFMTREGKQSVWRFLRDRRALYVLDESMFIKTPGAKRTKSIVASGRYADYKRVLCGTPVPNSPFDIYPQIRFLDEDFWKRMGIGSALAFRHRYAHFAKTKSASGREMEFPVEFVNLDELRDAIRPIQSRVLKEKVLDLPPKLYSQRTFELSGAQRRIYEAIRDEFMVELENGELVTAPLVITRLLRLQQITCGYLPTDNEREPLHRIDPNKTTPRLQLVEEARDTCPHQAIVWANWNEDIDQILDVLGDEAVRFDGQVTEEERERGKAAFKGGEKKWFVSKPSTGGTGHTLTEAKSCYYYNNSYNLMYRLQSEDRAHRINQDRPVQYYDFMAEGTVDEKVVAALRRKYNIAAEITGDEVRAWL